MTTGISPVAPADLDRHDPTTNPKQPRDDGKRPAGSETEKQRKAIKDMALDDIEDAIPPANAPTH